MSACSPEALEAYADGELDREAAADVAAHLPTCRACAEELRLLRAERRLFQARAAAHPPPPPFEEILARATESARAVEASPPRAPDPAPAPLAARARRIPHRARRGAPPWLARGAAVALALAAAMIALWRAGGPSLAPAPAGPAPRAESPPIADLPRSIAPAPDRADPEPCFICQPSTPSPADPEPERHDDACAQVEQDLPVEPGSGCNGEENVTCRSGGPHGE